MFKIICDNMFCLIRCRMKAGEIMSREVEFLRVRDDALRLGNESQGGNQLTVIVPKTECV